MSHGKKGVLRHARDTQVKSSSRPTGVAVAVKQFEAIDQPTNDRSVMLLGKTGCGKSTLANFLVGEKDKFYVAEGAQWASVTVKAMDATCTHDERQLHVVDTPGFCDTDLGKREENLVEIANGLIRARDGVHALIVCNSVVHRFGDEELLTLKTLEELGNLWDHSMVIFTNADRLGDTIEEQEKELKASLSAQNCPEGIKTLMKKTKNRYVLVESVNRPGSPYHYQKLKEIFTMIDTIYNANRQRRYTNRLFELAVVHFDAAKEKLLQEEEQDKATEKALQQGVKSTIYTAKMQPPGMQKHPNMFGVKVLPTLEKRAEERAAEPFKEALKKDSFIQRSLINPTKKVIDTICSVM